MSLFINSRLCIFLWSLGGWILATSNWWGSGRTGSTCPAAHPHWVGRRCTRAPRARQEGLRVEPHRRPGRTEPRASWRSQLQDRMLKQLSYSRIISFHCWHLQRGKSIACIGCLKKKKSCCFAPRGLLFQKLEMTCLSSSTNPKSQEGKYKSVSSSILHVQFYYQ